MKTGPRRTNEPELMGVMEAADALGVRRSNLSQLVGLPEPYQKVKATKLYRADEIRAFDHDRRSRHDHDRNGAAA
jgi:hypothetical protein